MTDLPWKVLLFLKDFTEQGGDRYFWRDEEKIVEATVEEVVSCPHAVVCHDFWMIRDVMYEKTSCLPQTVIDLDEFRIATSGNPDDRQSREKADITRALGSYGATEEICSTYRRMFNRGVEFDAEIAREAANAMAAMYVSLCEEALANGEHSRFFDVEVPVYRMLQQAMSAGINITSKGLSEKRRQADFDYFVCLKDYSTKHDMPLETPSSAAIEDKLTLAGFDLTGVSIEYVLEFLPHIDDFGTDTLALQELDAARRVLSSLTLSSNQTRPVVDVFGSRTSRIQLRSPSLQNIPKKYRSIVRPSAGAKLSYVDFDQYEVGIMAALSDDPELKKLYAAGDMYELFATMHLGLAGNRKAAKQLFLSYAYGMSRKALIDAAVSFGAQRERAKSAFKLFTTYEHWKKSIWEKFRQNGRISTMQGNHFRRARHGPLTAREQRSVVSQVVQGTASLIFKSALIEVAKLKDVAIILPMHDALLFEHRTADTPKKVVATFQAVMTSQLEGRVKGKASIGPFTSI